MGLTQLFTLATLPILGAAPGIDGGKQIAEENFTLGFPIRQVVRLARLASFTQHTLPMYNIDLLFLKPKNLRRKWRKP
jgi:hypothetical protein